MRIWLDDVRPRPSDDFVHAKSYDEFVLIIEENGAPDYVSFDHDLGVGSNGQLARTGMDCAKWLIENDIVLDDFNVHSANPVGKANIRGLLDNWNKFKK